MRRSSYYAKLSLVQISDGARVFVIDATTVDLTELKGILVNQEIVKIFHSPLQDIQIFYKLFKVIPLNVFDTQIACAFCGFRSSISYSDLCLQICNVLIDKTYQATDWLARPLSDLMIEYAAHDVKYLHQIYHVLLQKIKDLPLYNKTLNDKILNPDLYKPHPETAWKKIKYQSTSPEFLLSIQTLAAFREECAMTLDIPRSHVLSDKDLIKICKTLPVVRKGLEYVDISKFTDAQIVKLLDLCAGLRMAVPKL
jgi:ribonuclease D